MTTLCKDCDAFAFAISRQLTELPDWHFFQIPGGQTLLNWRSCRLCKSIHNWLLTFAGTIDADDRFGGRVIYGAGFDTKELPFGQVTVGAFGSVLLAFSVWCAEGSVPALSGQLYTSPPLSVHDSPEAFDLMRRWLDECRRNHDGCRVALSGVRADDGQNPLPTRVLDVGGGDDDAVDAQVVTLFETQGARGHYCALSYCWGPPGANRLQTTRANLDEHLRGIDLARFPKTLRDAVTVTRQLGIRYLWIDALCIIQNDDDWKVESVKMADVYQGADLVIAAAWAHDPEEGCFGQAARFLDEVEVPYYPGDDSSSTSGCFNLSLRHPNRASVPASGRLAKRGWALQESYLARRLLAFMPQTMCWRCKAVECDERALTDTQMYGGWHSILQRYSRCELTYPSDRLVAVQGLATAFEQRTGDVYRHGVFEKTLLADLFWTRNSEGRENQGLEHVPSWSWASKPGPKVFWSTQDVTTKHDALIDRASIIVSGDGWLHLEGFVTDCELHAKGSWDDTSHPQPPLHLLLEYAGYVGISAPPVLIRSLGPEPQVVGLGWLDDSEDKTRGGEGPGDVQVPVQVQVLGIYLTDLPYFLLGGDGLIGTCYGVLFLRGTGKQAGAYERVGAGLTLEDPRTLSNAVNQAISII